MYVYVYFEEKFVHMFIYQVFLSNSTNSPTDEWFQ